MINFNSEDASELHLFFDRAEHKYNLISVLAISAPINVKLSCSFQWYLDTANLQLRLHSYIDMHYF